MNRYIISPAAKSDLLEIRDSLMKQGSRKVAARVLRDLRDAIQKLADMPGMGHLRIELADESLRFCRVYKYPIICCPETKPLEFVRVLHGARDVRSVLET